MGERERHGLRPVRRRPQPHQAVRLRPLGHDQGLALFDAALGSDEAVLAPVRLNEAGLTGDIPPILEELAPTRTGKPAVTDTLVSRLAELPEAERDAAALEFVRSVSALVFGYESGDEIDPQREFSAAGLDSIGNLELSRHLAAATGLRLPATLVFDHPTPAELASHLRRLLQESNS